MSKKPQVYNLNGFAGLVEQRKNRMTGFIVGLYHSLQSGMESDPDLPWTTVCERHHNLISHPTMAMAKTAMTCPEWCSNCQRVMDNEPEFTEEDPYLGDPNDLSPNAG